MFQGLKSFLFYCRVSSVFFEKWFNPFFPFWLCRKDANLETSLHLLVDLHSTWWLMGGKYSPFLFPFLSFFFGSHHGRFLKASLSEEALTVWLPKSHFWLILFNPYILCTILPVTVFFYLIICYLTISSLHGLFKHLLF